jgi:Na+-driven multidrug efflux pump
LIVSPLVNTGLDIFVVTKLGWSVAGVAWATLIAQAVH